MMILDKLFNLLLTNLLMCAFVLINQILLSPYQHSYFVLTLWLLFKILHPFDNILKTLLASLIHIYLSIEYMNNTASVPLK